MDGFSLTTRFFSFCLGPFLPFFSVSLNGFAPDCPQTPPNLRCYRVMRSLFLSFFFFFSPVFLSPPPLRPGTFFFANTQYSDFFLFLGRVPAPFSQLWPKVALPDRLFPRPHQRLFVRWRHSPPSLTMTFPFDASPTFLTSKAPPSLLPGRAVWQLFLRRAFLFAGAAKSS